MIKLLSLDLDKTITESNSWEILNTHFGISEEDDKKMYYDFMSQKISYKEWLDKLADIWKENKEHITKQSIMDAYNPIYKKDIINTIKQIRLENPGIIIGITTGAPSVAAEKSMHDLNLDFVFSTNHVDFNENAEFTGFIDLGDETLSGKPNLLSIFAKEKGVFFHECMHVGDSRNDIQLFRSTGNGVSFKWCKEDIKNEAKVIIEEIQDLPEAIKQINEINYKNYQLIYPYIKTNTSI